MEDDIISVELFISLIEERPNMWDKSLDIYKNKVSTQNSWKEILVNLYTGYIQTSKLGKKKKDKNMVSTQSLSVIIIYIIKQNIVLLSIYDNVLSFLVLFKL